MKNNTLLIVVIGFILFLIYRNGVKVQASSTVGLNQNTSSLLNNVIGGLFRIFDGSGSSNSPTPEGTSFV